MIKINKKINVMLSEYFKISEAVISIILHILKYNFLFSITSAQ